MAYLFRARGIIITRSPAEYSVKYLNGNTETAQARETLSEELELAEQMRRTHRQRQPSRTQPIDRNGHFGMKP